MKFLSNCSHSLSKKIIHQHHFLSVSKVIIFSTVLLLNACASWWGTDNTEPPTPLVDFTPTVNLTTVWKASAGSNKTNNYLKLTPAVDKDTLFSVTSKGQVRAFNVNDGKLLWEHTTDLTISGGVGVGEELVLVGSQQGSVIALSAADGAERWRAQVSSEILSPPRISQGIVVVRTGDGKLFGLNSQNGGRVWVHDRTVPALSLRGTSAPLILDEVVVAGFDNGKLTLIELLTGKLLWEANAAVPRGRSELERMVDIDADPQAVGSTVYVTSFRGRTVALDLRGGQLLWEREVSSYAGLGISAKTVYISDTQSHVAAFDRYSGASLWKQTKLQARAITAPVSIDNYVVVGDIEGYLHWMRRDDGQFVARYSTGNASISVPPLVVNDLLITYTSSGDIIALQPQLP